MNESGTQVADSPWRERRKPIGYWTARVFGLDIALILFGLLTGALIMLAVVHRCSAPAAQSEPHANMAPRYSAIANFGVLPIDQPEQWLVARDKAGNDLGTLPVAPGELVLRSEKEPELHAPDYVGAPWTITFK
jgi:hypothetical protein